MKGSKPASCTATRFAANTGRSGDCASTTPSCCSIRTPRPSPGSFATRQPAARLRSPARRGRTHCRTAATTRPSFRRRSSSTTLSTGRASPLPNLALEQLVIYEVHVKGFTAHPSVGRRESGHLSRLHREDPAPQASSASTPWSCLPVHEFYVDDFLAQKGLTNYWGYNSIGFFAPESSYCTGRTPGCQVAEFKTLVRELHRAGIKVILDVVYNHTGEGNEMGPSLCFPRHRQPLLLQPDRARRRAAPLLHELHRLRQQPQLRQPGGDPAGHGFAALLGRGDARRRFPLRSRVGARARRADGYFQSSASFFDAVSQDPVLNRADHDRGAVGHRHLSGGQFPGGLVRMERKVPRHDAPLRQRATPDSWPTWAGASPDRPISTARTGARRTTASTSSPATTASRSTISSPTTASTTSRTARTIRTAPTTTTRGTAASKARPTIPPSWRCASS